MITITLWIIGALFCIGLHEDSLAGNGWKGLGMLFLSICFWPMLLGMYVNAKLKKTKGDK